MTRVVFLIIRMMAVTSTGVIVRRVVRGVQGAWGSMIARAFML